MDLFLQFFGFHTGKLPGIYIYMKMEGDGSHVFGIQRYDKLPTMTYVRVSILEYFVK